MFISFAYRMVTFTWAQQMTFDEGFPVMPLAK
jgi:hypothetical protein